MFTLACSSAESREYKSWPDVNKAHIETLSGLPIVKVKIQDQKPLNFILDTGSFITIIAKRHIVDEYENNSSATYKAPPDHETSLSVLFKETNPLSLSLQGTNYSKNIPLFYSSNYEGHKSLNEALKLYDGVLGLDFFCGTEILITGPRSLLQVQPINSDLNIKKLCQKEQLWDRGRIIETVSFKDAEIDIFIDCLLYTSPSPRD